MLERTQILTETLKRKYKNLSPHLRQRRALFNGIGHLSRWLFGTLDSDDKEQYDHVIETLQHNQKQILKEINLQSSLSHDLINNYNNTITTLYNNQQRIKSNIEKIQSSSEFQIRIIEQFVMLQGTVNQIDSDSSNLINFLENLENAILFSKLNTLHSSIITTDEIFQMLEHLKTIYPENSIIEFENALSYYLFLGTQVTFTQNKIVFATHFPILKPIKLSFFQIYPIIQNHKTFTPRYPFVALNDASSQIEPMECPSIEKTYYCQETHTALDECTMNLLQGKNPKQCALTHVTFNQSIIQQINDNLIVIPAQEEQVRSMCSSDRVISVKTPTIIRIPANCVIRIHNLTFTKDKPEIRKKPFMLPKIDISEIPIRNEQQPIVLHEPNFQKIYELKHIADHLQKVHEVPYSMPVTISSTLSTVLTIFLIVLAYLSLKHYREKQKKQDVREIIPMVQKPIETSLSFSPKEGKS